MLKRNITYKDYFTGEETTEEFYFNLTEREIIRLDANHGGNLLSYLQRLQATNNSKEILDFFENVILSSYGQREGVQFIKDEAVVKEFTSTPAWDALFMELATEEGALLTFFLAVVPEEMRTQIAEGLKEQEAAEAVAAPRPPAPVPPAS